MFVITVLIPAITVLSLARVAIGYDEGTIMIKLGREEPVASMDNSGKIIWAKQNEIQTVNIKAVPADFEVFTKFRVASYCGLVVMNKNPY